MIWLQAIARITEYKSIPSPEDLRHMRLPHGKTIEAYAECCRSSDMARTPMLRRNSTEIGAPNTRSLAVKLQGILDLIWYQLDNATYMGGNADGVLTTNDMLKLDVAVD